MSWQSYPFIDMQELHQLEIGVAVATFRLNYSGSGLEKDDRTLGGYTPDQILTWRPDSQPTYN